MKTRGLSKKKASNYEPEKRGKVNQRQTLSVANTTIQKDVVF